MTKRELVIEVAKKLGFTQNDVAQVIQCTLDTITEALAQGKRLEIRNFGVFEVKTRDARIGRNPRTGEEVPIPEKRVATFKPGKEIKEMVEKGIVPEPRPPHPGPPTPIGLAESTSHAGGHDSSGGAS